jgi:uncharacterized protein DUF4403
MRLKIILLGSALIAVSFIVGLKALDWLSPHGAVQKPALAELPPLPPAAKSSVILATVTIPISAIRDLVDRSAARNFAGKADNPVSQILQNADIGWTASRGPISAIGGQDVLSLTSTLTGKLNVTGSLSSRASGAVGDAIGSLLGGNAAKQIAGVNIKELNAAAALKGNVTVTSRPKFAAAWRVEPNLGAEVKLGDTNLAIAGARVNVPAEIKPLLDKTVGEQIAAAGQRIRNDGSLERNARLQWAKACRSIPLQVGAGGGSAPALWLELKPTRAIAVQPNVDASAVTMTLGVEAETRITPTETTPSCPFPDKISVVPPTAPVVAIGIPVDIPFSDITAIMEAQLAGKTFPEDGSGPVSVTVKRASVAASNDRLLISLFVSAKEKSFFGLTGEANVYIWGKPALDQAQQKLRLANLEMAVESEAAFGLLGAAARAVMPHLQRSISEKATVDLKPMLGDTQKMVANAISDLQKNENGVRVTTEITRLQLADVAFDSKTLRVIAEAAGTINIVITALPGL